jgi:hypothetical protein
VAERAWSAENVTDIDSARDRINEHRCKMLARGLSAEPLASGAAYGAYAYCPQEFFPVYQPPWGNNDKVTSSAASRKAATPLSASVSL